MPFLSDLAGRVWGNSHWMLTAPLIYEYVAPGALDSVTITVPKGFVTDLATIPRIFMPLLPVNDRHRAAAALHDFLYHDQPVSRRLADAIFRAAMRDLAVPGWKRWVMWAGVRAFGWTRYGKQK